MRLCVFTEPQLGADYEDLLAVARRAEECGFEGFFRSDHYVTMGAASGLPGPTDAWLTLAALARDTSRVRLGTLVTAATFRLPGPLAIAVAQVDRMSGGRVELGLGAGWYEREHLAYGIPFPSTRERFDRLAEQLEIITGLWAAASQYSFDGSHYTLVDAPALPKPVQRPGPPVIIGGTGPTRTPALAARYAAEYNVPFASVSTTAECFARVSEACASVGRATPPVFSAAQTVVCGRTDAAIRDRAEAIGRSVEDARSRGIVGTPEEVAEQVAAYGEAGASRMFLQVLHLADLDHLDDIASALLQSGVDFASPAS